MELAIAGGTALKNFTRALTCLTKLGDEIDVTGNSKQLKLSTVNSSRSAFGSVTFNPNFFTEYQIQGQQASVRKFSVIGKALLSALKPRSANSIESVTISVSESEFSQSANDSGECRLIIRLHCQHGVVKTHRLTYSACDGLHARANRNLCTSRWVASSRILKDWTDHFHLRSSNAGGGTDEISFSLGESSCTIKSFGQEMNEGGTTNTLSSRPLATELLIETEDFDSYEIQGNPLITFALKEFKAIIILAESVSANVDAAFTAGGSPVLFQVDADQFLADFVIATSAFDATAPSGASTNLPAKKESTTVQTKLNLGASTRAAGSSVTPASGASNAMPPPAIGKGTTREALFNPASQASDAEEDFDQAGFDFDESALAEIDRLSQQYIGSSQQQALVPNTTAPGARAQGVADHQPSDHSIPTQPSEMLTTQRESTDETRPSKKSKWNLFD